MATSGTTSFDLDVVDVIEEAYERVGKELRGGYDLKTARRSLDLLMKEWANRGLNMWKITEQVEPISAAQETFVLPANTIDIIDASWRTGDGIGQTDRVMTRMSVVDWAQTANKRTTSSPSRFWVNRLIPPVVHIWPVPVMAGSFVYYKLSFIEDSGAYGNTMDIPTRFLPAMTSGLAYQLAIKTPGAAERIPMLQAEYERQFQLASDEDRDRTSLFLVPARR